MNTLPVAVKNNLSRKQLSGWDLTLNAQMEIVDKHRRSALWEMI